MNEQTQPLAERLQTGPGFLMLGHRYLALESGSDSLLTEIIRRYGPSPPVPTDYFSLFQSSAAESGDAALGWIDDRCHRLSPPHSRSLWGFQFQVQPFFNKVSDGIARSPCRSRLGQDQIDLFNPSPFVANR